MDAVEVFSPQCDNTARIYIYTYIYKNICLQCEQSESKNEWQGGLNAILSRSARSLLARERKKSLLIDFLGAFFFP